MSKTDKIARDRGDPFGRRLLGGEAGLPAAARRVARFINGNRAVALASSAADLAVAVGTSDASVVRAVKLLGFSGIPELKRQLAVALDKPRTPAAEMRRTLSDIGADAERAIELVFETHLEAIATLRRKGARGRLTQALAVLHPAARIVVFGIGPSAPLAHYAALLLSRNGRTARTLESTGIALADQLLDIRPGDALLVIAYGPAYPEVTAVFAEARRLSLKTVLVTDSLDARLARRATVVVPTKRGKPSRAALHGATLVTIEALILGLAASDQTQSLRTLERLNDLRAMLAGKGAKA